MSPAVRSTVLDADGGFISGHAMAVENDNSCKKRDGVRRRRCICLHFTRGGAEAGRMRSTAGWSLHRRRCFVLARTQTSRTNNSTRPQSPQTPPSLLENQTPTTRDVEQTQTHHFVHSFPFPRLLSFARILPCFFGTERKSHDAGEPTGGRTLPNLQSQRKDRRSIFDCHIFLG